MSDAGLERLVARHREAVVRMQELPVYNSRLRIEPVGFRNWDGHRLGILTGPWFMNLVLLPGEEDDWSAAEQGDQSDWHFPGETVRFTATRCDDGYVYLAAPVFTTVLDFPDQQTARKVAGRVLASLLAAPGSADAMPEPGVSRRDLFRGRLRSGDR